MNPSVETSWVGSRGLWGPGPEQQQWEIVPPPGHPQVIPRGSAPQGRREGESRAQGLL